VGNGGHTAEGGKPATGGISGANGGSTNGGSPNGGSPNGGSANGGSANGGSGNGGSANGGTSTANGGASTGGRVGTGGEGTAGHSSQGGTLGSGGTSMGGKASGGSGGQVGGSAGMTSTGGVGGESGYNPCKASPCVILPLGDSITHGYASSDDGGYRSALFKLIVAANQNVTFIGSKSNGPSSVSGKTFPKNHEGWDGITITGITGKVPPAMAFSTAPHIVLLHIGTNDMTNNANPTTAASQLSTLLTNLVNAAPNALIVVAKIVPLGYNNSNYTTYVSKISDVVKTFDGKHVVLVDMSTLPSADIRGNGDVHPTDKGYADMANLWYGVIKGYLPQ
jgi:lysophospholipase L1-like esterase